MKRRIVLLATVLTLGGCATDGAFKTTNIAGSTSCADSSGYTFTGLYFGEGKLVVIPISKIRRNTEWRFYLLPEDLSGGSSPAYGTKDIKIDVKTPPPVSATPNAWLEINDEFDNGKQGKTGWWVFGRKTRYFALCVPDNLSVGDRFHFFVDIEDVGHIDPRAHVER